MTGTLPLTVRLNRMEYVSVLISETVTILGQCVSLLLRTPIRRLTPLPLLGVSHNIPIPLPFEQFSVAPKLAVVRLIFVPIRP